MYAELVSPELALVDPELAERARRSLPEPDTLARLERAVRAPDAPPRARHALRTPTVARTAVLLVLGASLVLNVNLLTEGGTAPRVPDQPAKSAAPIQKAAPRYGVSAAQRRIVPPHVRHPGVARPRKALEAPSLTLRWPEAPSAVQYDLVIWRGHQRVLDVWRRTPRVDLADLPCTQARKLRPGLRYLWFAYPLLRGGSPQRFGPLLRYGVFRASRSDACGSKKTRAGRVRSRPASATGRR